MRLKIIGSVVIALGLQCSAVAAQAADAEDLAEGLRLFTQKGNCQGCHGWAGDGRKMDNQMPTGANLRESQLDRNNMVMTIKCGRPGRGMPAYDRLAYSDGRCYGQTKADLNGIALEDPPATLQPREIETLVDFLFAKVVKQGAMNLAKCRAYWGGDAEVCREFK
jgi:mono/diheme cytochrome c family protein